MEEWENYNAIYSNTSGFIVSLTQYAWFIINAFSSCNNPFSSDSGDAQLTKTKMDSHSLVPSNNNYINNNINNFPW